MTKYVPTWERNYDRWETEPDSNLDFLDEEIEEIEIEDLEISEDEFDEEFDLDKWEEM
jgi:hypothetical protein